MDGLKSLKLTFRVGSILVAIIELIVIASIFPKYEGVISYGFFIVLIPMQPIWYFNLTNSKSKIYTSKRFKSAALILVIVSISIPIFMYAAIPKYTYDDGLNILKNHLQSEKSNDFLINDDFRSTISVTEFHRGFPKNILMNDKFYLYLTFVGNEHIEFAINPITGEVLELNEGYTN